jgi:hypothetical protein
MSDFDPEKFEDKYAHYFEEIEAAYSNAYDQLHGRYDSQILRFIDRQVLSESEPVYEGDGEFSVRLPDDVEQRKASLDTDAEQFQTVLDAYTTQIERELTEIFEFDS